MLNIWMLSQFYLDPLHSWDIPVCTAYGANYFCPLHPTEPDGWALVRIDSSPQHVEAAKQDPRVVVCGRDYNTPPAKVLEVYKDWLDPAVTYMFMGQVLARLAEIEPNFHHQ